MAQQSFAGLAVLVVLTFAIMAVHGCSSSDRVAVATAAGTPEYHDANIGDDALRSRLPSED